MKTEPAVDLAKIEAAVAEAVLRFIESEKHDPKELEIKKDDGEKDYACLSD